MMMEIFWNRRWTPINADKSKVQKQNYKKQSAIQACRFAIKCLKTPANRRLSFFGRFSKPPFALSLSKGGARK
jgi:hypothetical protein